MIGPKVMLQVEIEDKGHGQFEVTILQNTYEGQPKRPLVWRMMVYDVLDLSWRMNFVREGEENWIPSLEFGRDNSMS